MGGPVALNTRDTGDRQLAVVITGTFTVVVFALLLLLWHRIIHRASRVAKWIMVALAVLGAVAAALPLLVAGAAAEPGYWLDTFATLLNFVAAAMLFRKDAVTWFAHERSVDPDTFV